MWFAAIAVVTITGAAWKWWAETTSDCATQSPSFYVCTTHHARLKPVLHSFRYPVLYIGVDLDDEGTNNWLFSFGRARRFVRVEASDYLGERYPGTIKEKLWAHLQAQEVSVEGLVRAYLVTTPRLLGYAFNPVSFHYVYDAENRLRVVVLEVNNTFSEKHIYILDEMTSEDHPRPDLHATKTFDRSFHVSPFNDRLGYYRLHCKDPFIGQPRVNMHLTLLDEDRHAKLTANVRSLSDRVPLGRPLHVLVTLLVYGTAVFLTVPRILYEAFRLHYVKKMPVFVRPEPIDSPSAVGWQKATATDQYFAALFFEYLGQMRSRRTVRIKLVCSPSLQVFELAGELANKPKLELEVFSFGFFSNLFSAVSPFACLLTDSICNPSPMFTINDPDAFLALFPDRSLKGEWWRAIRGPPPDMSRELHLRTTALHVYGTEHGSRFYWKLATTCLMTVLGETIFRKLAHFTGDAGAPGQSWRRVDRVLHSQQSSAQLEWARRRLNCVVAE